MDSLTAPVLALWVGAVALILGLAGLTLKKMEPRERPLALLSALFFFLVLCGYFFLRPVRDAMGVARGMGELRWLFGVTSAASLLVVLAFGGVVARTNRRRFIPAWYGFVIVCLLGFAGLLIGDAATGGGLIGSRTETALARGVGYTYYVWLSVVNLFMTSVFWSFMVDIFDFGQGKRIFAFIGAGGTLGSIVGSWTAGTISGAVESAYLPAGFMLAACALFAGAVGVVLLLDRMAPPKQRAERAEQEAAGHDTPRGVRVGGTFWEGAKAVATSPYMLGIGLWVVFLAVSNTLIYFAQANLISQATDTFSERVANFAYFDFLAQSATLMVQVFVTARLLKWLGVGWTLAIVALVTLVGFAVLAVWPVLGVLAIFQAVHRATRHAVSRPARETLFSVVTEREKYKAKPVVDVFLYRGGDVAGMGIDGLFAALGLGVAAVAMATAPLAGFWIALSAGLAAAQARKAAEGDARAPAS